MIEDGTRAAVERWIELDGEYGTELQRLLVDDPDQVATLFDGRIAFGTAGLRANMGPGPRQMNRLVVRQTTAGLMDWLPSGSTVVIGYDARHHSKRFAADAATMVLAGGGRAVLIDRPAPTPVLARAVLDERAAAGIMITASHNPATDNGYKLYVADGIQLVAPADAEIAAAIDRVAADTDNPVRVPTSADEPPTGADAPLTDIETVTDLAIDRHRQVAIEALVGDARDVNVLYTAMHGVGGDHLLSCFAAAGFAEPAVVAAQFDPDPDFPTAPFPNPEEPGAFDLAIADATASGDIDLILANDPDADRLAVGIADTSGNWRRLSGDEVGALLADYVLQNTVLDGADGLSDNGPADGSDGGGNGGVMVASSIVSSRFIDRLARSYGADSIRTLTGFKWVARPIVERPDDRYAMGYEEALGYCIGDRVRDKDGISAALVMAELAAVSKAAGQSLQQRLDGLAEAHGLHLTSQVTVSIADLDDDSQAAVKRRAVGLAPDAVGGVAVTGREDLSEGRTLPPTSGVMLDLADGSRIIVRPSGTEPKIKAYLEVIEDAITPGNVEEARRNAELRLKNLADATAALLQG
ncbi:MAG: phospho-sugar mutase [Actinomycetota bacterium]